MNRKMTSSACTVYNELRLEGQLCDAVIMAEGTAFNVHKIILCGCSNYFRVLFTKTKEKREYSIPGISAHMMRLIIEFAYTHHVFITIYNVEQLLAAADQFAVLGLMQACFLFLEAQLSPENCIGICQFAEFYSPELQQAAYRYLLHHFGLVAKTSDEFLALSLDQLLAIINQEGLNVQQDHVVDEAIMRWIAHAPSERRGQFSALQSRRKI